MTDYELHTIIDTFSIVIYTTKLGKLEGDSGDIKKIIYRYVNYHSLF